MTPEDLRNLADEATPGPWELGAKGGDMRAIRRNAADPNATIFVDNHDARLIALAPDLARLCAELGEALAYMTGIATELNDGDPLKAKLAIQANDALAKLSELEAR